MAILKLAVIILFASAIANGENVTETTTTSSPAKAVVSDDAVITDAEPISQDNSDNSTASEGEYGSTHANNPADDVAQGEFQHELNQNPFVYGVVNDAGSYGRPHGNPLSYSPPSTGGYGSNAADDSASHSNDNNNSDGDNIISDSKPSTGAPATSNDDIVVIDNPSISDSKPSNESPSNSNGDSHSSDNANPDSSYGNPNPSFEAPAFSEGYPDVPNSGRLAFNSEPNARYAYPDNLGGYEGIFGDYY